MKLHGKLIGKRIGEPTPDGAVDVGLMVRQYNPADSEYIRWLGKQSVQYEFTTTVDDLHHFEALQLGDDVEIETVGGKHVWETETDKFETAMQSMTTSESDTQGEPE